jgi:hypothetical protein
MGACARCWPDTYGWYPVAVTLLFCKAAAVDLLLCTCCGMLLSLLGIQAGMTDQKKLLA